MVLGITVQDLCKFVYEICETVDDGMLVIRPNTNKRYSGNNG